MTDFRTPGVYVEESLLVNSADTTTATSVALFVGPAGKGSTSLPVFCSTWSDFVVNFGGFDEILDTSVPPLSYTSYLPYAVYSYFQNGGRPAYVQRAVGSGDAGAAATYTVTNGNTLVAAVNNVELTSNVATLTTVANHNMSPGETVIVTGLATTALNGTYVITATPTNKKISYALTHANIASASDTGTATVNPLSAFTVTAASVGTQGNDLGIVVTTIDAINGVFNVSVLSNGTEIERFQYLTMTGDTPGTRKVDNAINDPYSGSTLVRVSAVVPTVTPQDLLTNTSLVGGEDPSLPLATDYPIIAAAAVSRIEGPVIVNLVGYTSDRNNPSSFIAPNGVSASSFGDRGNVFVINDSVQPRTFGQSSTGYKSAITSVLGQFPGDSYVASFTPWIIIPDPARAGATITVPPGGAVAGVMSRIDSTIGVFRAPAGIVAGISNAVGVDTKYSDSELGDLNTANINAIRSVQGTGIAIMGARTRKLYAADRYISARRTLIYIKESLRRSTQFALFENNDQRLWSQLIMTAERLLRPLWEAGGLRGANAAQAYYIKCDDTINTPALIQSGEVRMEIGVALEYPAEFIVIRVTQFESGGTATEVQPAG